MELDIFFLNLSPVYAYDKVFVASRDGEVKALDPETRRILSGKSILSDDVPARLSGGLTASYDKVFVGY